MKAPKFEVSLADRQRQKREAVAKIQGKKAYRIFRAYEDDQPVQMSPDDYLIRYLVRNDKKLRYDFRWGEYEVKILHPKEAMLLKLQGYDIEEV